MTTEYKYRVVLVVQDGPAYDAARAAMAQVTGEAADATATWRMATDDPGSPTVTHRVADTLARPSTVALLPALAAQIGGGYHVLVSGRRTPSEVEHKTLDEALGDAGVWLLSVGDDDVLSVVPRG